MDTTLRPGDFPLGSLESRMAARAEIERAEDSRPLLRIYLVGHPPHDCGGKWCFKPADEESLSRDSGLCYGKLSPGPCGLTTGKLVLFPEGCVGEDIRMSV
jgi:hypothetical protein